MCSVIILKCFPLFGLLLDVVMEFVYRTVVGVGVCECFLRVDLLFCMLICLCCVLIVWVVL